MVNNHACLSVPLLLAGPELIPKRPSVVRFQVGDNESGTSKTSIAQVGLYGEGSHDGDDDDENSSENSNIRDMLVWFALLDLGFYDQFKFVMTVSCENIT